MSLAAPPRRRCPSIALPRYKPHDLRYKWATVTLSNGVPIHEVSRWMGHSSIKITVDRYGHLTLDGRSAAVRSSRPSGCTCSADSQLRQHLPLGRGRVGREVEVADSS
ncbi:tyrosine-type recombinase/integrase [Streptomyces kronopolitis]|uniref:tyrosine-type recombinase/integrase n=1 Tax=Streptomyces kronopolitis TaxID=1612435 RepID=UPI0036C6B351